MSELIIGIDLGTTNSLAAVCENGVPRILKDESGGSLVPSVIHYDHRSNTLDVGLAAKNMKVTDSLHTAFSVKRFMGLGKGDLKKDILEGFPTDIINTSLSTDQNIILTLGEKSFSAIELSSEILIKLKNLAEKSLGQKVKKAVITVPAYFNDSQRTATKAAGTLAGLDVIRIINEPTAAALAYGLATKKNGVIAVYDLGGGTFDISILRLHDGIFEVLATHGDTRLGGDDFDQVVFGMIKNQLEAVKTNSALLSAQETTATLLQVAEELKMNLGELSSTSRKVEIGLDKEKISHEFILNREDFEKRVDFLVSKTIKISQLALTDAGVDIQDIDEVVMVGGSTRLKIVQKAVLRFFNKKLNLSVNPDEAVALGAAIQADILGGRNQETVLLDVVPLSLGIETYGGTVGKLVHRNTKIPTVAKETFTTHVDGQRNVLIHVLQGERELAADCRSLARFDLKGLPSMPAGLPKIEVTFVIDASGILKVKAKELNGQTQAEVEVTPSYGLSDEQVEKMLKESFDFAEVDMQARQLVDTKVEAEGVLRSAGKIVNEGRNLISGSAEISGSVQESEVDQIEKQIAEIRRLMRGADYIAIREGLEKLEESAKGVAGKVMNHALKNSLNKKSVDEVLKGKN